MKQFIDDIISYIDTQFSNDDSLTKTLVGHYAYEKGLEPDAVTPFYTVQLLDNSTSLEDFDRETVISVPLQINVYGVKMKVGGVLNDAQNVSLILAEKCISFLEQFKYSTNKVISMRRITCSPALPYDDGSKAYYSAIRYNIQLKMPYVGA